MPNSKALYTYRAGQKVMLSKEANQFVVRLKPDEVKKNMGVTDVEEVSPSSTRVTLKSNELEGFMEKSREIAPTHHAYTLVNTEQEFLITDRIFVTFHQVISKQQLKDFENRYVLELVTAYNDKDYLFRLTNETGMNPIKLIVKLTEQEPLVETADHDLNRRMTLADFQLPADPDFRRQWHLHKHFMHPQYDVRSSTNCEEAWKLLNSYGSSDVVVGFTDDGCKMDHEDFNSANKFVDWGYFKGNRLITKADRDANSANMYDSPENHGTACAGVIAAEADSKLTIGAAPECKLLPIKWEFNPSGYLEINDSKMLMVLDFIADKVDVLSNSWGGVPVSTWSKTVIRKIEFLALRGGKRGKGIVFLWAAGNENCPIQHFTSIQVPYTRGWIVNPNGQLKWVGVEKANIFENNLVGIPGVMHVAAIGSNAKRSHYSNYGTGISLCAPSNNIQIYRGASLGLGITTTTGPGDRDIDNQFGGTSSATPLVAGIAALVISANPELTALEVISILKQTASEDLNLQGYPRTTAIPEDPDPSWDVSPIAPFDKGDFRNVGSPDGTWSPWFGHGKVDANKAVGKALQWQLQRPAVTSGI